MRNIIRAFGKCGVRRQQSRAYKKVKTGQALPKVVPERWVIYYFIEGDDDLVYIGSTANSRFKERMQEHQRNGNLSEDTDVFIKQVFRGCATEKGAKAYENGEINLLNPKRNFPHPKGINTQHFPDFGDLYFQIDRFHRELGKWVYEYVQKKKEECKEVKK
jgi:hypothetical protein